jgi:putative addiction module component (TIGR02574 family)
VEELREVAKYYLNHADEQVVKMVYAMLAASAENEKTQSYSLSPQQEAELDRRMRKYEQGQMEFTTWDEAKARIIANRNNAV